MSVYYSGYLGILRQPVSPVTQCQSSIYAYTDITKSTLIILPLSPGFLTDAYLIAKLPTYHTIYIIAPSTDALYISDIFNLYMELKVLGKTVKIMTQTNLEYPTSDQFIADTSFGNTHNIQINDVPNNSYELIIQFNSELNTLTRPISDVLIMDEDATRYFTMYMSNTKLDHIMANIDNYPSEIHMPFSYTMYGGLTYLQVVDRCPELKSRLITNGFVSVEAINYCITHGVPVGKVRCNDFLYADGKVGV